MKCILFYSVIGWLLFSASCGSAQDQVVRYVTLGDSYTIGTGATPETSWPAVLVQKLQAEGVPIKLVANLGRAGWTAENVIQGQLPVLEKLRPDLVTLLIGVNDWVQGVPEETFRQNFVKIIEEILKQLPHPERFLIITIPDFSVMPAGPMYSGGRAIAQGIARFNAIIKEEAQKHHLSVIDLFPLSQTLGQDPSLISSDGLHPSAKAYARWAEFIFPEAKQVLVK